MKSLIFLLSFALLSAMTFKNKSVVIDPMPVIEAPIPNIEFDIQFIGTVTGTPTLSVNGFQVASSAAPKYWSAFVDEANSYGLYNFKPNKCYTIKGNGGIKGLCITFNSNYKLGDAPTIEYNVVPQTFKITNPGRNCTVQLVSQSIMCCVTKYEGSKRK